MHEFAIANSIQEIVYTNIKNYLEENPSLKVDLICVRYGALNQLVPDILQEAFSAIIKDDEIFKNAKLELTEVKVLLKCSSCQEKFSIKEREEIFLPCPHCKNIGSHTLLEGKELIVDHIEAS